MAPCLPALWSISTKLGFYLLFPLLIQRWERTWAVKLAVAVLVLAALDGVAALPSVPPARPLAPDRASTACVSTP